jgi:hypothetical protein
MNPSSMANAMLARASGSVGDPSIHPQYIGDPTIHPNYIGAPIQQAPSGQMGPVTYSDTEYVSGDVTWFGFGITSILAGAAGQIVSIKPLRPITPQKIFAPSTNQGLLLGQASVGGTNIFANQAGVPIELFSEVSTAPQIRWPTIDTAVGIDFTLINPTAGAIPFTGAMYGTALRR